MLASSRTYFCQVVYVQNIFCFRISHFRMICLSFSTDLFIFSDLFCCEMNLPSIACCDSGRTHPPFLASSRPPKNLRNEPCFFYYVKQIDSIRKHLILDPFQRGTPLDLYFLSEIRLLDVSHSRRTNFDFYRICGSSASTLPHICLLYTSPSPRDKRQSRMPSSA